MATLATAGTRKVLSRRFPSTAQPPAEIVYAPLTSCWAYFSFAEERTLGFMMAQPRASGRQVLAWLKRADEATRTRVMELVRQEPKHTVGEALPAALQELAHEWAFQTELVLTGAGGPPRNTDLRGPPVPPPEPTGTARSRGGRGRARSSGGGKGGGKGKGGDRPSLRLATHYEGREICKKWNDGRGCQKPCPQGHVHVCNAMLPNGKPCGTTGHTRIAGHPKDGAQR